MSDESGGFLERHPDLETLRRFGAGELSRSDTFDLAWHLYLCPDCRGLLDEAGPDARAAYRRMFGNAGMQIPLRAYTQPMGRIAESLGQLGLELEASRAGARQLAGRLLRHSPEHRRLLVRERPEYRTFSVADRLVEVCRITWSEDPAETEEVAELALAILDDLDPVLHPEAMLNDVRAQVWAVIGNCRRVRLELASVSRAFDLAEDFLRRGTGDPVDEASFLDLQVSYLIDLHRYTEADSSLKLLLSIYRDAADRHSEGRVLLKLAELRREQGRMDAAIACLEQAQSALSTGRDPGRDPDLELVLRRTRALFLAEAGRAEEAQALMAGIRALAREQGNRAERLRVLQTAGVVYRHLGHLELAVEALEQARVGFLDLGLGYDAAFATLDLALAFADGDEAERAQSLAAAMLPLFDFPELHPEVRAALAMVRRALEVKNVDRGLVDGVAALLRRAHRDPEIGLAVGSGRAG